MAEDIVEVEEDIGGYGGHRSILRRPGCLFGLILWCIVMLLPFAMVILAVESHITWSHGKGMPERAEHPRLEIRLLSEIDYRGLSITNSSIKFEDDTNMSVQTNVRFFLWEGEGESVIYCDYYEYSDDEWIFVTRTSEVCE